MTDYIPSATLSETLENKMIWDQLLKEAVILSNFDALVGPNVRFPIVEKAFSDSKGQRAGTVVIPRLRMTLGGYDSIKDPKLMYDLAKMPVFDSQIIHWNEWSTQLDCAHHDSLRSYVAGNFLKSSMIAQVKTNYKQWFNYNVIGSITYNSYTGIIDGSVKANDSSGNGSTPFHRSFCGQPVMKSTDWYANAPLSTYLGANATTMGLSYLLNLRDIVQRGGYPNGASAGNREAPIPSSNTSKFGMNGGIGSKSSYYLFISEAAWAKMVRDAAFASATMVNKSFFESNKENKSMPNLMSSSCRGEINGFSIYVIQELSDLSFTAGSKQIAWGFVLGASALGFARESKGIEILIDDKTKTVARDVLDEAYVFARTNCGIERFMFPAIDKTLTVHPNIENGIFHVFSDATPI